MKPAPSPFAPLALLALSLSFGPSACGEPEPAPVARNVLLLTIDTVRADHLSCYGYGRETTPNIDAFAAEGALFRNPTVHRGGTWPSLTSILTSLYPRDHGVRFNGDQLDASKRILAEELAERGFTTAAVLTNMTTAPNRGFQTKLVVPARPDSPTTSGETGRRRRPRRSGCARTTRSRSSCGCT